MAINDDAVDDLDSDVVIDDDIIQPPGSVKNKDVVVIAKTSEVKDDVTPLNDNQLSGLLQANSSFVTVVDGVTKTTELKDIEKEIVSTECISKHTAGVIDASFGDYLGSGVSLEEFTNQPSKINFTHAVKFMRKRIAAEEVEIASSYKIFIEDRIKAVSSSLSFLKDTHVYNLKAWLDKIEAIAIDLENKVLNNKNLVVSYDGGFTRIDNVDISTLDFSKISIDGINLNELEGCISALNNTLTNSKLKQFIYIAIEDKPIQALFDSTFIEGRDLSITVQVLAKFFSNSRARNYLESLVNAIEEKSEVLITLQEESGILLENIDKLNDFLLNKPVDNISCTCACIQSATNAVSIAGNVLDSLEFLYIQSSKLFDVISKF